MAATLFTTSLSSEESRALSSFISACRELKYLRALKPQRMDSLVPPLYFMEEITLSRPISPVLAT